MIGTPIMYDATRRAAKKAEPAKAVKKTSKK
jgi:hypothetical protein